MHLIFLSRWLPYPPDVGSKLRVYNLLKGLKARGYSLHLISFYSPDEDLSRAREGLAPLCRKIEFLPYYSFKPASLKARLAYLSPWPRFISATFQPAMRRAVQKALADSEVAALIASELDMSIYGLEAARGGVPAILEEVETGVIHDRYSRAPDRFTSARNGLTWLKYQAYLRYLARYYRAITVVSEQERNLIRPLTGPLRLEVLPNGIDLSDHNFDFRAYQSQTRARQLIFNGSLNFNLNLEAMKFFLAQVFPLVRSAEPELDLMITGRYSVTAAASLKQAAPAFSPTISLSGYVENVQALVANSLVSIAPLLSGGGTRLKILEAFAVGTPVVATSKGAEGLAARHGRHLLIADTSQDFANTILQLIRFPDLAAELACNARQHLEDNFNWQTIVDNLDCLIRETIF